MALDRDDVLRLYVNEDNPLGPIAAEAIEDRDARLALFDESNLLSKYLEKRPSIIIGRKGAGKTAFLNFIAESGKYDAVVYLKSQDVFFQIVKEINRKSKEESIIFTEQIAEMWDKIFYLSISREISKSKKSDGYFDSLMKSLKVDANDANGFLVRLLHLLRSKSKDDGISLLSEILIDFFKSDDVDSIKRAVHDYMKHKNINSIILVDTLEDYKLDDDAMSLAFRGLLKSVGSFNVVRGKPEIRFCLPAELYSDMINYSSNILKDFQRSLLLHWHSSELLSLVANRYKIYLELNENISTELKKVISIDVSTRRGAVEFFSSVLPPSIKNMYGMQETSLAYIMRHTQLLPRQMIAIVSSIIAENAKMGGVAYDISEAAVIEGVNAVEDILWREVCKGFEIRHPDALRICERVIPNLPVTFSSGDLHKIVNRSGLTKEREFTDIKKCYWKSVRWEC